MGGKDCPTDGDGGDGAGGGDGGGVGGAGPGAGAGAGAGGGPAWLPGAAYGTGVSTQPSLPQKHRACQSLGRHMVVTPVPQIGSPVVWLVSVWLTSLHHEHFWCAKHHALFGKREGQGRVC